MLDYQRELEKAVQHFWRTRGKQKKRQGGNSGHKDAGNRGAVTGGKHADGFVKLIAAIVKGAALPQVDIHVTEKGQERFPDSIAPVRNGISLFFRRIVWSPSLKSNLRWVASVTILIIESKKRSVMQLTSGPPTERVLSNPLKSHGLVICSCSRKHQSLCGQLKELS